VFISEITSIPHYTGTSLEFDSLDEVADALRKLGELLGEKSHQVEELIVTMRDSIASNITYSAFADVLTRGGRRGPTTGPAILLNNGFVANGRFFVHNDQGMSNWPPFENHMVRVNELSPDDGPVSYKLTVTNMQRGLFGPRSRESSNHSESLLAKELGRERPLRSIEIQPDYEQIGPHVEFDLEPLLRAVQSVDGIKPQKIDPFDLARYYYDIECVDGVVSEELYNRRPDFRHASGATIWLSGLYGIQSHTDTIGKRLLVKLDGNVISGPPSKHYKTPHATFYVKPADGMSNADLTALADEFTGALWSNNFSLTH
jgi:hypothetical protein